MSRMTTIQYFKAHSVYAIHSKTRVWWNKWRNRRRKIGDVIIHENQLPHGVITDKILRSKITTSLFNTSKEQLCQFHLCGKRVSYQKHAVDDASE
jgi:CBS domain-containing protein